VFVSQQTKIQEALSSESKLTQLSIKINTLSLQYYGKKSEYSNVLDYKKYGGKN